MQETFFKFFSTAGALFQNFLQFKSGGKQIDDVKSHIQPTIEMRDFLYPPTSGSAGTAGSPFVSATTTKKFPMHGGAGIYRIRGVAGFSCTSVGAGDAEITLIATDNTATSVAGTSLIYRTVAATTNVSEQKSFDFLLDCRVSGSTAEPTYFVLGYTACAGATGNIGYWHIVAQRVI